LRCCILGEEIGLVWAKISADDAGGAAGPAAAEGVAAVGDKTSMLAGTTGGAVRGGAVNGGAISGGADVGPARRSATGAGTGGAGSAGAKFVGAGGTCAESRGGGVLGTAPMGIGATGASDSAEDSSLIPTWGSTQALGGAGGGEGGGGGRSRGIGGLAERGDAGKEDSAGPSHIVRGESKVGDGGAIGGVVAAAAFATSPSVALLSNFFFRTLSKKDCPVG